MRVDDFDYELPAGAIAQRPSAERAAARLLVHDLTADRTEHRFVRDLPAVLRAGDLLVVNDTRVIPARVFGRRASGGLVEFLLLGPAADRPGAWRAMVNPARKLHAGESVRLELPVEDGGAGSLRLLARTSLPDGRPGPEWIVAWVEGDEGGARSLAEALERAGRMPLPPYIERPRGGADPLAALDRERYQTVYAREPGAIAAPTAGLHLTPQLLAALAERGVEEARVTLHVGEGTFRPLRVEDTREHRMHAERYEVPEACVRAVAACRARGGRVVAVGTTSVRSLEASVDEAGSLCASSGETDLFLTPGSPFRVVDALLTNFHLPRSTLLMLVSAFAGRERVLRLYDEALREGYRFLSYGDAMLLHSRPGAER